MSEILVIGGGLAGLAAAECAGCGMFVELREEAISLPIYR